MTHWSPQMQLSKDHKGKTGARVEEVPGSRGVWDVASYIELGEFWSKRARSQETVTPSRPLEALSPEFSRQAHFLD